MGIAAGVGVLVAVATARLQAGRPADAASPLEAGAAPPRRGNAWMIGLAKTRGSLARRILDAWAGGGDRDAWLMRVEEILLGSDVGVKATQALLDQWRREVPAGAAPREVRAVVRRSVRDILAAPPAAEIATRPEVILVVGVNGVGKTTTIGKLAH